MNVFIYAEIYLQTTNYDIPNLYKHIFFTIYKFLAFAFQKKYEICQRRIAI